jgi:hypothetical protein
LFVADLFDFVLVMHLLSSGPVRGGSHLLAGLRFRPEAAQGHVDVVGAVPQRVARPGEDGVHEAEDATVLA